MMVTQIFSKRFISSKILDTYVAASFFGTLIFFVLHSDFYTPFEMIFWVVLVTIAFKGLANIMFSLSVALVQLDNEENRQEFEESSTKVESLVNDLAIQEAAVQSHRIADHKK